MTDNDTSLTIYNVSATMEMEEERIICAAAVRDVLVMCHSRRGFLGFATRRGNAAGCLSLGGRMLNLLINFNNDNDRFPRKALETLGKSNGQPQRLPLPLTFPRLVVPLNY